MGKRGLSPLSQTSARCANECLAKLHAVYVEHLPVNFSPFQRGSAIHAAAEAVSLACQRDDHADRLSVGLRALETYQSTSDEPLGTDDWFEACRIVTGMVHPDSGIWWGGPGPGHAMQPEVPWGLTEDFAPCAPDDPACAITGRIDRLDYPTKAEHGARWQVSDLKSGYVRMTDEDVRTSVQALTYSLWVLSMWPGASEVEFRIVNLRHHQQPRWVFKRGGAWEEWIKSYLRTTRARIAECEGAGEWPATVGDGCGSTCPLHPCNALIDGMIAPCVAVTDAMKEIDLGEPGARARLYLAAKSTASTLERELRKRCEDSSIDLGNGKELGFTMGTRPRLRATMLEALAHLRADGAHEDDLAAVLTGDRITPKSVRAIAALMAKRDGIDADMVADALVERVPSATFTARASVPKETT